MADIGGNFGSEWQWRRHGGGGGSFPPISDQTMRSMQIRGDFHVEKNVCGGGGVRDLLPRFTCTDATAGVLWSYVYETRSC